MKQNLKERVNGKNGITLIALVITIIVLLILVGVTIATLTGENGILTRVQSTKTQNEKKTIEEQIHLALQSSRINEGLIIDKAILEEELSNNEMEIIKSDNNELPWTIRKNSYLYMIKRRNSNNVGEYKNFKGFNTSEKNNGRGIKRRDWKSKMGMYRQYNIEYNRRKWSNNNVE